MTIFRSCFKIMFSEGVLPEAIQLKGFVRIWMDFFLGEKIKTKSIFDIIDKS